MSPAKPPIPWWNSLGFRLGALISVLLLLVSGLHGLLLRRLIEDHLRERRAREAQGSPEAAAGRSRRLEGFPYGDPWIHRSLAILAGSWIAGLLAVRFLVGRLDRLRAAVEQLRGGDLAARVEPGRDDEIGRLLAAFNSMAERLETAHRQLSEQDQARRNLLADISHELRTPLAGMLCNLELLLEGKPDGDDRRRLAAAIDEARAAGERVEDLLTLARSDLGELPLQRKPLNLQRFLQELVDRYQPMLETAAIEVETDFGPEIRQVSADPRRLDQVFRNLIENARAAMREGGQLRLEVRDRPGQRVEVAVRDTGPGIPPEELTHLFERFRRGQGGREGGTGLGLAITRRLAEAHGGSCTVESRPGEGACFRVELPVLPG